MGGQLLAAPSFLACNRADVANAAGFLSGVPGAANITQPWECQVTKAGCTPDTVATCSAAALQASLTCPSGACNASQVRLVPSCTTCTGLNGIREKGYRLESSSWLRLPAFATAPCQIWGHSEAAAAEAEQDSYCTACATGRAWQHGRLLCGVGPLQCRRWRPVSADWESILKPLGIRLWPITAPYPPVKFQWLPV